MQAKRDVKICLLGDSGVGKSSLVQRFVHNTFNALNESTIGASFMTKTVVYAHAHYKLNLWDTAGQERYRALSPMYYRGAHVCLVVYDVTAANTFAAAQTWVRQLHAHLAGSEPTPLIAIAGNKADLAVADRRQVSLSDAKQFADSIGALFFETSAKSALNVQQLFVAVVSRLAATAPSTDTSPYGSSSRVTLSGDGSASAGKQSSDGRCCGGQ